jgi:type II secretory pathway component GspD/PulD (secretin)
MENITVDILSKEEIKAISKNGVKLTKNLASHINRINRIKTALDDEIKAVKEYVKKEYGIIDNAVVTVENRPTDTFNKADFIAVYGEDEYKRFVEKKDKYFVTFHG